MGSLDNKVALVTGAASGIGRASAIRFASEGARVMLADLDAAGLESTCKTITDAGGEAATTQFDATSEADCVRIVEETVSRWHQLDIVGNIAGIASFWHLHEITTDIWEKSVAINLTAPMIISREAMPHLVKTQGNIINMSSTAGRGGQAYNAIYTATKYGITGLTKSLALEFASKKVRVNAICPGGVNTAIPKTLRWAENMEESLVQRLMSPIEPMAEPDEIAKLATYLASDDARFVTGVDWAIDGGQTA